MAWEYIDLPETGTYGNSTYFTWEQGLGISPGTEYSAPGLYLSIGSGMLNFAHGGSVGPFTTSYGLSVTFRDSTSYASGLDINANNVNYCSWGSGFDVLTYRFAINRETEDSAIIMMRSWQIAYNRKFTYLSNIASANDSNRHDLYLFLIAQIPPEYNWQSVPSISGKNGILSLAQIKEEYINDGESVSGASADHFTNLSTENRVDVLIDDALPAPEIGGTTVTVKYTIPSLSTGSYEYCKLVAKKNSMPEGPEDGDKIIDVDPSSTSIVVRGLDELSTYYFVIFIEDDQGNTASSEPKSCKTGERGESEWRDFYQYYGSSEEAYDTYYPQLIENNFKIIDAKDYWTRYHRFIVSDIAPILTSVIPFVSDGSISVFEAGNYYNSAFSGTTYRVCIFCMWDRAPIITELQMGQPMNNHVFYDSDSGKWILMANASWNFSTSYTEQNTWSSDLPLYVNDEGGMKTYCRTPQNE